MIISEAAEITIHHETSWKKAEVEALAHALYSNSDVGAAPASGSFQTDGMVVIPCSVKTLSAIAHSYNSNLLVRAADVTLKERRPLVVVFRETPIHLGHIRLMMQLTEMGGIILPPVPSFYHKPQTLDDIINHTIGKVMDLLHIDHRLFTRWTGIPPSA